MRRFQFSPLVALTALTVMATAQTPPRSASTALPQASAPPPAASAQYRQPANDTDTCPVDFSVTRRAATDLLEADSAARRSDAQAIDIVLSPGGDRRLRSAEIVVHAYTGGPVWLPVRQARDRQSIVDRSFHVEAGGVGQIRRSLVMQRVNGIESVDIVTLRFADGQSWRAFAGEACRAVPSLYLAVGAAEPTAIPR